MKLGDKLIAKGPYGTCFRREERPGPMLLIGGGSGMSPLWSILADHIESGEQRPMRFFYGARTRADLFYLEELAAIAAKLRLQIYSGAVARAARRRVGGRDRLRPRSRAARHLREEKLAGAIDAYACGPPPMIDAVSAGPADERRRARPIYFDKFTPAYAMTDA